MTFCSSGGKSKKDKSTPWPLAILVCAVSLFASQTGCSRSKPQASTDAQALVAAASQMRVVRFDPALDAVIEPGTPIQRIATGFQFGEGPMWRQGRLWFSDLVGNEMFAVAPDGVAQQLIDHSGGLHNPPPGSYTVFAGIASYLYALDLATGKPIGSFATDGASTCAKASTPITCILSKGGCIRDNAIHVKR